MQEAKQEVQEAKQEVQEAEKKVQQALQSWQNDKQDVHLERAFEMAQKGLSNALQMQSVEIKSYDNKQQALQELKIKLMSLAQVVKICKSMCL